MIQTTTVNLTKREYVAAQILGNLITLEEFSEEQAVEMSVKLADALLKKEQETKQEPNDDTLPDPAWDYTTLWGVLCTIDARVKALKTHLSQFEESSKETDEETYHQLIELSQAVNGALDTLHYRGRTQIH